MTVEQHIVEIETVDGKGQPHIVFHRNTHGTGIGTVSGDTYRLVDTISIVDRVDRLEDGTTISTQFYELVVIRQGETGTGDDLHVRMMTRIAVAPDGTQTIEIEFWSVECR